METGLYTTLTNCRFCDQTVTDIIHMGNEFPLAGGFLRSLEEVKDEKVYPLSLVYCPDCCLLQCKQIVNPDVLFKKGYFYYSSMIPTLVNHFSSYAKELASLFTNDERKNVLCVEIGCNDGVFLRPLQREGFRVVGVDPSDTPKQLIVDGFSIYNDYFNEDTAEQILKDHGMCDIFLSSNSFAHINDMKTVMKSIKRILKPNGLAIIEVHDTKSVIEQLNFDFIYHEHMSYYTLTSFDCIAKRYGFRIEKVERTTIHGQSIRVHLRYSSGPNSKEVEDELEKEKEFRQLSTYLNFSKSIEIWREDFNNLFRILNTQDAKIYGYGSSGRANIICTYADIDLKVIIDDAKSKIGSYTPIKHVQIQSPSIIETNPPDYILILAWPYAKDIICKVRAQNYKGRFIVPLPKIMIS